MQRGQNCGRRGDLRERGQGRLGVLDEFGHGLGAVASGFQSVVDAGVLVGGQFHAGRGSEHGEVGLAHAYGGDAGGGEPGGRVRRVPHQQHDDDGGQRRCGGAGALTGGAVLQKVSEGAGDGQQPDGRCHGGQGLAAENDEDGAPVGSPGESRGAAECGWQAGGYRGRRHLHDLLMVRVGARRGVGVVMHPISARTGRRWQRNLAHGRV